MGILKNNKYYSFIKALFRTSIQYVRQKRERTERYLLQFRAVQLLVSTIKGLGEHDASHMAAGVSYFAILSFFPLLLGLISILGFILPSETVQEELFDFFRKNLPESTDVLEQNIDGVIQLRSALGILSLFALFWSASGMFSAIGRAINRASNIRQDRPFLKRKLGDILMVFGIAVLFLLSLGMTSVFTTLSRTTLPLTGVVINLASVLAALLVNGVVLLIMYKIIPNATTFWRYVWPGAILAAIALEAAKVVFLLYLSRLAHYELVYGSVGSVIVFLLWVYVSAFILIIGAEFNYRYGLRKQEKDTDIQSTGISYEMY
ncbi:YihY/virulence factor BrkB family protein [Chloroflexota bacterium]